MSLLNLILPYYKIFIQRMVIPTKDQYYLDWDTTLLTQGKINFRNKKIPRCISYCRRWTKLWQEKNTRRRRQSRDFGCGWHSL